jgi:hypothetical protein
MLRKTKAVLISTVPSSPGPLSKKKKGRKDLVSRKSLSPWERAVHFENKKLICKKVAIPSSDSKNLPFSLWEKGQGDEGKRQTRTPNSIPFLDGIFPKGFLRKG